MITIGALPPPRATGSDPAGRVGAGRLLARIVVWLFCLGVLTGCDPSAGGFAAAPSRVQAVLGGAVKVAAPAGYCIEPAAVLQNADAALVLIGRCTGGPGETRARAILTAAVGAAASGLDVAANGAELAAYFNSKAGRTAISRSRRADSVTLLEAIGAGDAFLMRIRDTSPNHGSPTQAESWRAVLGVAGRLVTLTVAGTIDSPLGREAGRALLDGFVAAMQAANRGAAG